jgi:hypothetical protein
MTGSSRNKADIANLSSIPLSGVDQLSTEEHDHDTGIMWIMGKASMKHLGFRTTGTDIKTNPLLQLLLEEG